MSIDRYPAVIDGESVLTSQFIEDVDPSTGETFALVARCQSSEVDAAVAAARHAYESTWRKRNAGERGRILRALGEAILAGSEEFALLESRDTGKPLRQARIDVGVAARYFEFYANAVETLGGATIPTSTGFFAYTLREAFGVTAHIIPWNYPLQIGSRTLAPALAAGNCCVLKPAEEAPLTLIKLGQLALEVGIPAGVVNIIPGYGHEAGAALAASPGVDHVAFTGSRDVGVIVARSSAANVVPVSLELGGKSPNIVFPDAALDSAVPAIVASIVQNAGQTCSAGSRLLVHRSIHEDVVAKVARRFRELSIGPGLDDRDLGPLISAEQLNRVRGFVEEARSENVVVVGGDQPGGETFSGGFFYEATLIDSVAPSARLAREEVFGPVLAVTEFGSDEEAVELANATEYGLIAAIWTRDIDRTHRLIGELRVGQVYVNTYGAGGGVELPFGGYKRSGFGREKGLEGLISYTQLKTCAVRYG